MTVIFYPERVELAISGSGSGETYGDNSGDCLSEYFHGEISLKTDTIVGGDLDGGDDFKNETRGTFLGLAGIFETRVSIS